MCASNLNRNLNNESKKHIQEQFLINNRSQERPDKTKKELCISNKRSARSQIRSTDLFNKLNKKLIKKDSCSDIISKYICQVCKKLFPDSQQYNQHIKVHKKHARELCNVTCATKKQLKEHQQNIHDVKIAKKHQCEICDKRFNRPFNLNIHKRVHTGEKPLKCLDCNKNYFSNKTYAEHLKTVRHLRKASINKDVVVVKKYVCEKCAAKFFKLQSLQRHMQSQHSYEEPLKCNHCTYNTKCKANLKRHLEIHSQTKRFACELCTQTFRTSRSLKDHHAFLHSNKRNFLCKVCNKSFKVNGDLQRHKKVHSDDRPYKCSCTCSFKRQSHLKRHLLSFKHVSLFDNNALMEELSRNISDNDINSCDDPIQFNDINNKINKGFFPESEKISSVDVPNGDSMLSSSDLCLSSNDKTPQTSVLHSQEKVIENLMVTVTGTAENVSTYLPNVFQTPVVPLEHQILSKNVNSPQTILNWTVDSQTVETIPPITSLVTLPAMALTDSRPAQTVNCTILTSSVEQPHLNFAKNCVSYEAQSVGKPVINFINNKFSNASKIELTTSIDQSALNIINNNLPSKVATDIHKIASVSNEMVQQCESHNFFKSRSSTDNDSLSNIDKSNVLNAINYIQSLTESSNTNQESSSVDLFGQANAIPYSSNNNIFSFSDSSSHPINLSLNTNFVDKNFNQQLPFFNIINDKFRQ